MRYLQKGSQRYKYWEGGKQKPKTGRGGEKVLFEVEVRCLGGKD